MPKIFHRRRLFLALAALHAGVAWALPVGPQVAAGSASLSQSGKTLSITNTPGAILNWQGFSIDAGETVRFLQQSAQSAVLNRVIGQNPSSILGSLQSNGRVFLINPNGIVFGAGARIDVAGLVASSLDMRDADFLAGRHSYSGGGLGGVSNQGSINVGNGAAVYLIGPSVENRGTITAPGGDIVLAAGQSVTIAPAAEPDVRVQITAPTQGDAVNLGELIARSGSIGLYGANVALSGVADASRAVAGADGRIFLKAGKAVVATAGSRTVADGGAIEVDSGELTRVDAGAAFQADGGRVRLWSDAETAVHGRLQAHGGFVETSGRHLDVNGIDLDVPGGQWLIDPSNISIENTNVLGTPLATCGAVSGGSQTCGFGASGAGFTHLDAGIINTALNNDTSVVIDTAVGTGGSGFIQLYGSLLLAKTSGTRATLTLNADNTIGANGGTPTISASGGAILDVVLSANRSTVSASGGINGLGAITTNGGNLTISASNIQTTSSAVFNTGGGTISLTANNASGSGGLNLAGSMSSGGGKIDLTSNSSSAGMLLYGTTDAGSGNLTLNLPNGGTARDNSTSAKLVASGLELLGNNATYQLGAAPLFVGGTGQSIYAPGSVAGNTAQSGNPVFTVAANLTGTSTVNLYVGTSNVAYVSGTGMNTDLSVGTVGSTSGLKATTVSLTTANGNIGQTQKITATDLTLNANSIVQGNNIDLSLAAGNSVTNIQSASARCITGSCSVGASATPSLQFTNATALNLISTIDAGNGAAVFKTLTGNLTLASSAVLRSALAGTAANYANAIILVAGANTAANFVDNNNGFTSLQVSGANARYLIYSKAASSITLGGLAAPSYSGSSNGGFTAYFGPSYYASPFNGSGLPAAPANAAKPNAVILQTQPTLTVNATAASRTYGNANPSFAYTTSGLVLGDTAAGVLSGSLGCAATATSGVGTYGITQGTLTAANGYNISYTGANLTVNQRPVSITANALTKTVGAPDPAFTYQVTAGSLANGDVLNLTRSPGQTIGLYPISLGSNPNYSVTYTGSNLSIVAAPVVASTGGGTTTTLSGDATRSVLFSNRPDVLPAGSQDTPPATVRGNKDGQKPAC